MATIEPLSITLAFFAAIVLPLVFIWLFVKHYNKKAALKFCPHEKFIYKGKLEDNINLLPHSKDSQKLVCANCKRTYYEINKDDKKWKNH